MIHTVPGHYLAINAGSSSIKFALYHAESPPRPLLAGSVDGIGGAQASFSVRGSPADTFTRQFAIPERVTAANVLLEWLAERIAPGGVLAVVHRVVHGAPDCQHTQRITPALLDVLYLALHAEPEHLPLQVHLIDSLRRRYTGASHIACFDSSFHACMPAHASILPIPHRFVAAGIRRYGYHGLACASMMRQLAQSGGPGEVEGKVVLAHLGGGASVTAVEHGLSRDTSMGLTPAGGIPMGTRSGDIDPGLAWHCQRHEAMTPAQQQHMLNHACGLLGVSGRSGDLRVLLAHEENDSRCADAIALFVYQTRKAICAMAGALDGIETLVFAGGTGANSADLRMRICARLSHLGIALDPQRNAAQAGLISSETSRVRVRVMHANEQVILAEEAHLLLAKPAAHQAPGALHE